MSTLKINHLNDKIMEKLDVLEELNILFRKVFNNQEIVVTELTVASDIDEWDSLNHAHLISSVEKHFKIKFKLMEMLNFKNVGKLCESIQRKINS